MATKSSKSKILIILGPTSTKKTDLALRLAKKFNGELVSCDSRQVYCGLDIGTGKAPSGIFNFQFSIFKKEKYWEINGVKIWMYDVVAAKKQYTVADYVKDANRVIDEITTRGKLPIIVGGTGFYLKALLEGLPNLAIPVDQRLRKELERLSLDELQNRLQKMSLQKWEEMNNSDRQNPRRLIRAIEISAIRIPPRSNFRLRQGCGGQVVTPRRWCEFNTLKIGLTAPRKILYQRIDERVVRRINQGMIDEAKRLHKEGLSLKRMKELGLEYGILADYLEGRIVSKEDLIKVMQGKIHGYARRQITWFKEEKNIFWFDIADRNFPSNVEKLVIKWYHLPCETKNRHLS